MAITKEEEDEVKVMFNFPLRMAIMNSGIETRRNIMFAYFSDVLKKQDDQLKYKLLRIIEGKSEKFKTKNIIFQENGGWIYMNNAQFFKLLTVDLIQNNFKCDFIKAQRIRRIYVEYIIEKMNKAFNP